MKLFKWIEDFPFHIISPLQQINSPNGRTYKLDDGTIFNSVTTTLSCRGKKGILEWIERVGSNEAEYKSRIAANRGSRFHDMCELYLKNRDPYTPNNNSHEIAKILFKKSIPVLDRIDNIICTETRLYSKKMKLAGQVDCIAEFDGELSVIDFKTSNSLKDINYIQGYFAQATAYSLMFKELFDFTIPNIVIIIGVEEDFSIQLFKSSDIVSHMKFLKESIEMYNKGEID